MNHLRRTHNIRTQVPLTLPFPLYKRSSWRSSSHNVFALLFFLVPVFQLFRQLPPPSYQPSSPLHTSLQPKHAKPVVNAPYQGILYVQRDERTDVAPFATQSTTLSLTNRIKDSIEAVLICHYTNPCCTATLKTSLRSLIRQTVIPDSLTLIHSCNLPSESSLLRLSVRCVLTGKHSTKASAKLIDNVYDSFCPFDSQRSYDECLLEYLAKRDEQKGIYRLLSSDREIFEPTAVEKLWMYMQFHAKVSAVKSLSFEEGNLREAFGQNDPMAVKVVVPEWNHTITKEVNAVPMMYRSDELERMKSSSNSITSGENVSNVWEPLVRMLSKGRLLREALFTKIASKAGLNDLMSRQSMLSLQHANMGRREIPPHLHSELAFYKWSAREEEQEMYRETFADFKLLDIERISTGVVQKPVLKRVMFLMPWIDMGGSEKAVLDLADRMLSMKWSITFVLTMPNWQEDSLGEMIYANAWLHKALSLSSDVINLIALAPNHLTTKAFRYVLDSRQPDFVFNTNTRWAYGHSALIRAIVPNAVVADYNHMIHESWFGGGLPRYGANNTKYFDVHFTASKDIASSMEKWIDEKLGHREHVKPVKPCYIGTDPNVFYTGLERQGVKSTQRRRLNISKDVKVVLFAGRFVVGKGTDIMLDVVKKTSSDANLVGKFFFIFVGDGNARRLLTDLRQEYKNVLVFPPAQSLHEMRDYYAMSDVLLLPSINEGIALVLYEAMAAEVLVISTDVGGQRELVTPDSGVLVPKSRIPSHVTGPVVDTLRAILNDREKYDKIRLAGRDKVRSKFTTSNFCDCVIDGMQFAERRRKKLFEPVGENTFTELRYELLPEVRMERSDGLWKREIVARSLHHALTIGIKTYVCDEQTVDQVHSLVRSIRVNYPQIRVLLGNDGAKSLADEDFVKSDDYTEEVRLERNSGISVGRNTLVNMTTTKYFLLLDDDHVLDDSTNFVKVVTSMEKDGFDIVGLRIRNLPGIDELERVGISIPRYVARIEAFKKRRLLLCLWNENKGPSVFGMENAIKVDVIHNAFMARTDVLRLHGWRDELQVNEHMTFFLDAWKAKVKVGYLPSEFVHHRPRLYSECYYKMRFRENRFRKMLDYEDRFLYDLQCGKSFPEMVIRHLNKQYS